MFKKVSIFIILLLIILFIAFLYKSCGSINLAPGEKSPIFLCKCRSSEFSYYDKNCEFIFASSINKILGFVPSKIYRLYEEIKCDKNNGELVMSGPPDSQYYVCKHKITDGGKKCLVNSDCLSSKCVIDIKKDEIYKYTPEEIEKFSRECSDNDLPSCSTGEVVFSSYGDYGFQPTCPSGFSD